MRLLAVLAKALAMIAGHRHDSRCRRAARAENLDDPRDLRIRVGDLAVVRIAIRFFRIPGRRFVRRMGIVEVHPQKERRSRLVQPGDSAVDNVAAAPLGLEASALIGIAPDAVVVGIESVGEPESTVEHVGANKGARPIPRILKPAGQRRRRGLRREHDTVVPDAMGDRQEASHDRDVRRQRERHRRSSIVESGAGSRQRVDGRSKASADPVSPERVDGDENDVGTDGRCRVAPSAATG